MNDQEEALGAHLQDAGEATPGGGTQRPRWSSPSLPEGRLRLFDKWLSGLIRQYRGRTERLARL